MKKELIDYYTGEIRLVEIPDDCIVIDKNINEANLFFASDGFVFWNILSDEILVDFFPNSPKSISDIPLFKSSEEDCFRVIVIEHKYKDWVDKKRRQSKNEKKRKQYIERQWDIYNQKCNLRLEGDNYRKNGQTQLAISSYSSALQVKYNTVNKWFMTDCIGQDLLSLEGLIAISHNQKNFEKERLYIEQAISLSSTQSQFKKNSIKFQHRLDKLLGTYIEKEIPPESHMNVSFDDLTNYMELLDKMYHPIETNDGCIVVNKKEEKIRLDIRKYFDGLMHDGKEADSRFDYKTASSIYERLVAERYYDSFPYDRLITLYFNYKMYEDEVRVITSAIETFQLLNSEYRNGYKNPGFHYYDKRIEKWEKRLISARIRLQKSKKKD